MKQAACLWLSIAYLYLELRQFKAELCRQALVVSVTKQNDGTYFQQFVLCIIDFESRDRLLYWANFADCVLGAKTGASLRGRS